MSETSPARVHRADRNPAPVPAPHVFPPSPHDRLAALAIEARRIARQRGIVEAVSTRSRRRGVRAQAGHPAGGRNRLTRRAASLGMVFHRILDQLQADGHHDEAMSIFRAYRADLRRRLARAGVRGDRV